ncbi:MAG: formylglycine-generating enzyme family protein, partial [Thermoguttaceae bacterium]|nr:formylglycine-generating enzyme family protein [Thermoguttaceae bacterium]
VEVRDYLASLGSQPTLADYWNERTARFQKLAFSAPSQESRMQAFLLAQATQLLSSDLKAGAEALKSASRGVDETLNAEGAEVYEKTFGEEFVAVEAEPQAGERKVLTIKGVDFAFRWCPSGTFMMGSPSSEAERYSDEGPRHEVTLTKGFWMLETSVTQGMYRAITGSNPSCFKSGDNYPVENVSWFDSQSFCESLNALGVAPEGFAFRLPTEAEWEYACRAGTDTPYFWGSTLNGDKANCDGNYPYGGVSKGRYLEKTSAVGSYTPNGWGLYDMHGNVYDWCADWFGDYGSGPQTDPTGPSSGSERVLRGGGWSSVAKSCRSANRNAYDPTYRLYYCGFRLVLGREL